MQLKLRHQFYLYLVSIHLVFFFIGGVILYHNRKWLFLVELLLILSLLIAIKLIRHFFGTLELIRSGAEYIAERDFTTRFSLIGQVEMDQLVHIYNEMIDQLRQERLRLQEKHYFLEKIVAASPLGIVTLDFENRIDLANPAAGRLLQREEQALRGRSLPELGLPLAGSLEQLAMDESRIIKQGGWRSLKCHKAQFFDRGFSRSFFLLEELTDDLRQSEKAAYEKLIRLMSHEVNNTVAATSSLLQSCLSFAVQLQAEDRADYEMALRAVISRAAELNLFMKGFADVVRLPHPNPAPCDLHALLEDLRILLSGELSQRQITWLWDIQASLPPIRLDRGQMEQALLNIIRNAMEAMSPGGTLTLRLLMENGRPALAVADNGAGIPAEAAEHLFTPLFSTKKNGQGVGLMLVREILEGHRFSFSLESSMGETRFTILFN